MLLYQVSSQEWRVRGDADFGYNLDSARVHAQRSTSAPEASSPYTAHEVGPVSGDMMPSYRGASGSQYPYASSNKSYYPSMAVWSNNYTDEPTVDYSGLGCNAYGMYSQEASSLMPYPSWGPRKPATLPSSSNIYMDAADTSYTYGTAAPNMMPQQRPAASSESQSFSVSSIAANLPSSGNERLLPTPNSSARSVSGSAGPGYRTDGLPSLYSKSSISSTSSIAASPVSTVTTETAATTYDGVPLAPYTATGSTTSVLPYHKPPQRETGSAVGYSGLSTLSDAIFSEHQRSIGSQGSGVDLTSYTYGSDAGSSSSVLRRSSADYSRAGSTIGSNSRYTPHTSSHHGYGQGVYGPSDGATTTHGHHAAAAATAVSSATTEPPSYEADADAAASSVADSNANSTIGGGGGSATQGQHAAVATRH